VDPTTLLIDSKTVSSIAIYAASSTISPRYWSWPSSSKSGIRFETRRATSAAAGVFLNRHSRAMCPNFPRTEQLLLETADDDPFSFFSAGGFELLVSLGSLAFDNKCCVREECGMGIATQGD
jgi:hypothetical protein